jgi:hypothetical protein
MGRLFDAALSFVCSGLLLAREALRSHIPAAVTGDLLFALQNLLQFSAVFFAYSLLSGFVGRFGGPANFFIYARRRSLILLARERIDVVPVKPDEKG